MNQIDGQREALDKIYDLLLCSVDDDFVTAECVIAYRRFDGGGAAIQSNASFFANGETKHVLLKYPDRQILDEVVPKLHSMMKDHTGGEWTGLKLKINQDGTVTTKFDYAEGAQPNSS